MKPAPIPANYPQLSPYITVSNATAALDFYQKAFGATVRMCLKDPSGRVGHADIVINGSHLMLADEMPEMGYVGPETLGGTTFGIALYVENVDEVFNRAVEEVRIAAHRLIGSLATAAPPRNREEEARKAKERSRERFASTT